MSMHDSSKMKEAQPGAMNSVHNLPAFLTILQLSILLDFICVSHPSAFRCRCFGVMYQIINNNNLKLQTAALVAKRDFTVRDEYHYQS